MRLSGISMLDLYLMFVDGTYTITGPLYALNDFFVRTLYENADFYINLLHNRYSSDNNINLENLSKLLGNAFRQHLLILLSAKALKKDWFDHLVRQLESVLC